MELGAHLGLARAINPVVSERGVTSGGRRLVALRQKHRLLPSKFCQFMDGLEGGIHQGEFIRIRKLFMSGHSGHHIRYLV